VAFRSAVYITLLGSLCIVAGCGINVNQSMLTSANSSGALSPPPVPPPPPPVVIIGTKQSIRNWTTCDGVTDDNAGVAQAFSAAKNNAFILEIDCPVYMHVGNDPTRPIFIDNGTQVDFSPAGFLILDNSTVPSFVMADTENVRLTNWNVKYIGSLAVDNIPSTVFTNTVLTPWLSRNRAIEFSGSARARWTGTTGSTAMFLLAGSTSNIDVEDMNVRVPQDAGADHFVPMFVQMMALQTPDQTVTSNTSFTQPYYAIPSNLVFSGITLDGTYFGFQGSARNVLISDVVSLRYGDLQDANGGTVGGIGDWFAPPHLFYFNFNPNGDPAFDNDNIVIKNVVDFGERVGAPRDTASGNCYSLKLGVLHGSVTNYMSFRPDGFMDVLPSTDLTLAKIVASYDSSFLQGTFPMIRFPSGDYHQITFTDMNLEDKAPVPLTGPIWGSYDPSNTDVTIDTTTVKLNQWSGKNPPGPPPFAGTGNSIDITYSY